MLNLPFILGDLFNKFDANWLNFINLNQILNLVFCYFYDQFTIKHLDFKIFEYLSNFSKLYPQASITPKLHYLTHLPAQMDNFGPLRHHACMRCESKNLVIKKLDYKSFKNICFSVADKHQYWISSKEFEQVNKKSLKYVEDISNIDKNKIVSPSILLELNAKSYVSVCKYLKADGFKYQKASFLIIDLDLSIGKMSVGMIKEIFIVDGAYVFYLQLCNIDKIHSNLNCLEISLISSYIYVNYDDLYFKQAQFGIYISNLLYLQVRYYHRLFVTVD